MLTIEQYSALLQVWIHRLNTNPHERKGQDLFNTILEHNPSIAEKIRGDYRFDPFYDNKLIPSCLCFVAKKVIV